MEQVLHGCCPRCRSETLFSTRMLHRSTSEWNGTRLHRYAMLRRMKFRLQIIQYVSAAGISNVKMIRVVIIVLTRSEDFRDIITISEFFNIQLNPHGIECNKE